MNSADRNYWAPMYTPRSREQHVLAQRRYDESIARAVAMQAATDARIEQILARV